MTTISVELTKHYKELLPKEMDEVVEATADLLVSFLRRGDGNGRWDSEEKAKIRRRRSQDSTRKRE